MCFVVFLFLQTNFFCAGRLEIFELQLEVRNDSTTATTSDHLESHGISRLLFLKACAFLLLILVIYAFLFKCGSSSPNIKRPTSAFSRPRLPSGLRPVISVRRNIRRRPNLAQAEYRHICIYPRYFKTFRCTDAFDAIYSYRQLTEMLHKPMTRRWTQLTMIVCTFLYQYCMIMTGHSRSLRYCMILRE